MKTGVIDVGGGMRGIYAAGVLDSCLDGGVSFDIAIGISSGSANLASFCARQRSRSFRFYTNYALREEYMGTHLLRTIGSFFDMDYVYGTLSNSGGEDPLDYAALRDNPTDYIVVATDAETGEARYFGKGDMAQDNYDILKASSSMPYLCKPYPIGGRVYYDGDVGDPVPVAKALELGCERIVLILSEPAAERRDPKKDEKLARRVERLYSASAEKVRTRAERYNEGVEHAMRLAGEGRALIVAPDDTCGVEALTRDKDAMLRLYEKGLSDGVQIRDFMDGK